MKRLKTFMICMLCSCLFVSLGGCSKKDETKLVTGTKEEIALSFANDFKDKDFTDFEEKYIFADQLNSLSGRIANILQTNINTIGNILSFEEPFTENVVDYTIVHIPTHFDSSDYNMAVWFTAEDEISNCTFEEYHTTPKEE